MKREEQKSKNGGITLIALVITIIVLLILAGITLNLTLGENGLLKKTNIAKSRSEQSALEEELELSIEEIFLENRHKGTITKDKLIEYLTEKVKEIVVKETTDEKIVVEYKGYEFEIDNKYDVKLIGNAGIKVTYTVSPQGYSAGPIEITINVELIDGVEVESITPQTEGIEVVEEGVKFKVTENGVYKFKLTDNSYNQRDIMVKVDNIDGEAPKTNIELTQGISYINGKIKAKVTVEDAESGVNESKCKWVINKSNEKLGTNIDLYTGGSIINGEQEIETQTMTAVGNYYIHVLTTDNAENAIETISEQAEIKNGYAISTPQEFQNMKNNLSASYYVVNDIDMSGFNFSPIGEYHQEYFSGKLDGQGYTISNLTISGERVAVFGGLQGNAKISNLIFRDIDVRTVYMGSGLALDINNGSNVVIEKVGIIGNIQNGYGVTAFVFLNSGTGKLTFNNCYARCNLSSSDKWNGAAFAKCSGNATTTANNCYWSGTNNTTGRTSSLITYEDIDNNNNMTTSASISVNNCYYDKEKFPLNINTTTSGTGLTTANMKKQESYVGWDFENTWYMGASGYPELKFK